MTKSNQSNNASFEMLRRRAEQLVQARSDELQDNTLIDVSNLLHELNVYQAELEIQNEELRQHQEALQVAHSRYMDLYDFAPVGYLTLDEHGLIREINLTGVSLLGSSRDRVLNQSLMQFIATEDRDNYYLYQRRLIQGNTPQVCELRLRLQDGTSMPVHLQSSIINESTSIENTSRAYRVAIVDISARVQAEEALRNAHDKLEERVAERTAELVSANQSLQDEIVERQRVEDALRATTQQFQVVLKGSSTIVFTQDTDLRYTWIYNNPEPFGDEMIVGKTDFDLLPRSEADDITAIKRAVIESGSGQHVEVELSLYGERRWYDLKIEPHRNADQQVIGLTCAATDVTDYHRAADTQRFLSQVSHYFVASLDMPSMLNHVASLITDNASDGCVIATLDQEAQQDPVVMVSHWHAERKEMLRHWFMRHYSTQGPNPIGSAIEQREPVFCSEPDEYEQQIGLRALVCLPLVVRGRLLGLLTLLHDQAGRPYWELDQQTLAELAQRVALAIDNTSLHTATKEARAQAEEALRMRNQVFRLISHDLRSPLTAIQGYAYLLKRRMETSEIHEEDRFMRGLDSITDATARMSAQLQELLDVASLQAGNPLSLSWGNVDLVVLLQRAAETSRNMSDEHQIRLETELTHLEAVGDEMRLERVLTNLLSNAIKYSPAGSEVRLTLAHQQHDDQNQAMLTIQDQGAGIPADEIPRLFEPFYRARNTADSTPGTGLGLVSVRQIIEQHGGEISVQSQIHVGTTFTICLPL